MSAIAPDFKDIEAAARRIADHAVRTPLLEFPTLNERAGARVLVKAETLQRTGSFKFRGAFSRLCRIEPDRRPSGVVAFSSGNHAQGVAAAARLLDMPATIVMPADAPAIKRANTERLGATVVPYDRDRESREEIAASIAAETGAVLAPSFDDPDIIAGQGTVGLEMARQARDQGAELGTLLIPVSGGGLISGCAIAFETLSPATQIHAVEPQGFDDTARSLAAGERIAIKRVAGSVCDALLAPCPGKITFPVMRRLLAGAVSVSDEEALEAVAFAAAELKLVVEPGGATALAAVLSGKIEPKAGAVGIVLSGGNIDQHLMARALSNRV
ncbi:MAG: threonine/serine dehydratase [Sphingomonadales bacterium]